MTQQKVVRRIDFILNVPPMNDVIKFDTEMTHFEPRQLKQALQRFYCDACEWVYWLIFELFDQIPSEKSDSFTSMYLATNWNTNALRCD